LAWEDWAEDDYQDFHDDVFRQVFDSLDFTYMSDDEIAQAEELFEQGWLNFHIPAEEKLAWREAFQNFTNLELDSDQWATYRELYDGAGG
jgi:hypothetical protein